MNRFGSLYGDQLTELYFYPMKDHILKSLTKIGKEGFVKELIGAMDRCIVQHDYLHESFHMLQAIYNEYWGGMLQPLVCLMNMKRVSMLMH